jgi:hypothetical protein
MNANEKIAVVILADLKDWQKLNVVAFLASSIAIEFPETRGEAFVTASKSRYFPFLKHPILIYKADDEVNLRRSFVRAKDRGLGIGIYTRALFETKCEEENHAAISKFTDDQQELVGIVVHGDGKAVSKALDGLKFHP